MEHAIRILEFEKTLLEKCLEGWPESSKVNYSAAFKQRNVKLKQINDAIALIKSKPTS